MGAPLSLTLAVQHPELWNGASLIVPYFSLSQADQKLLNRIKPVASLVNKVKPKFRLNVRKGRKLEPWIMNWADDPLFEGCHISASNIMRNDEQLT